MSAHLAYLPPELYTCILDYVTDQQTVLALTRCLPYAGISVDRLFHSIRIRQPETVPRLYRRIQAGLAQNASTSDASHLVYHLSVETWNVDADVLTNLLRLLPSLRTLIVWIGPSNFSPEHLEEMFKPPMHNLNVRKATYYQFHKGSYFDSTLLALSTWPKGLPTLSIVQDTFTPDPSDLSPRFAQPIVFFRLALHLSLLIHSPASHASLTSLRIRIPARPIIQPLTIAYLHPTVPPISTNTNTVPPPPSLDFLDVATCNVSETDIEKLLMHFTRLKHLVLDECTNLPRAWSVSSQALGSELEWWSALGRRLVMAGVKRAREREKELRTWYEENFYRRSLRRDEDESQVHVEDERETQIYEPKRPKRGRRGLATATITLRGATTSPPRAGPAKKPSPERSRRHGAVSSSSSVSSIPVQNNQDHKSTLPLPKVHVVPPLPSLKSISLFPTPGPNTVLMTPEVRVRIKAEFEKGWYDGLRVLWEVRGRMGTTFMRRLVENKGKQVEGVLRPRFFVFRDQGGQDGEPKGEEREGHEGLDDVLPSEEDIFVRNEETSVDVGGPPVLCLAGSDVAAGGHEVGCGHFVGRDAGLESL
ncbi:hypothetical protein C0989_000426 [Termitomyces sp. Mn162]|nr:hypothetical protein C0989_000426 [Termitomyces sp. Mn162]